MSILNPYKVVGVDTSDATAAASDILSGKTAYADGEKVTGIIPLQDVAAIIPGVETKTAVEAGRYTTGDVTVVGDANLAAGNIKSGVSIFGVEGTVEPGVDTSDATATDEHIVEGFTAYVDGEKVTGTIPRRGPNDLQTDQEYVIVPAGFYQHEEVKAVQYTTLAKPIIEFYEENGFVSASVQQDEEGYIFPETESALIELPIFYGDPDIIPGRNDITVVPAHKYVIDPVVVRGDENIIPGNIKEGISIFGVEGTLAQPESFMVTAGGPAFPTNTALYKVSISCIECDPVAKTAIVTMVYRSGSASGTVTTSTYTMTEVGSKPPTPPTPPPDPDEDE